MRVAFVHPRFPGSEGTGATHSATQVVEGLAERGHDLRVYCTQTPTDERQPPYERTVLGGRVPHTNTRLNRAIRSRTDELGSFDVVHSYLPATIPAIGAVGEQTDAATAVTLNAYKGVCAKNDLLHLDRERCQRNDWRRCINCILRTSSGHEEYSTPYRVVSRLGDLRLVKQSARLVSGVDAFRAPSRHVKENYEALGFPGDGIQVIPHPIDDRFVIDHESSFTPPYRLLYVGTLERQKGVDRLIPILAALESTSHEFSLTVIGDGGLREQLREQAAEYGVTDRVEFRGFVPNASLPEIYAAHDCFVYPGRWDEPLGRVYLEALASGTPIVTTGYGSIADIVGEAGRVTDGSIEQFRETLVSIIEDAALPEMSRAAEKQTEQFRLERVLDGIEAMYEQIV